MPVKFHKLVIVEVRQETPDSVSIAFDIPARLEKDFAFIPGQYVTLRTEIEGDEVRRSYSICSVAGEPLRVGIKHVWHGKFSSYAQSLKPGDMIEVMPPDGRFRLNKNAAGTYILIAAGSGITPILSIAKSVMMQESLSNVVLVYGNCVTGSIMFREALEDLKDQYLERFHAYHVLSREARDVELFHGRITPERIGLMTEKGLLDPQSATGIYLCGPAEMNSGIAKFMKETGVAPEKIHVELFKAPDDPEPDMMPEAVIHAPPEGVKLEVILDGLRRNIVFEDPLDTVLEAARKAGLELPFSCAGGMCATCRCRVVEGEVAMAKNYSLSDWELEKGFVLGCQSRPKSEKLVLDFDAT